MELTKRTFDILNNFSTINKGIVVEAGNRIRTISEGLNILAIAEDVDTFEQKFAIYDLKKFLSSVTLYEDPVLDFNEKFVKISSVDAKDSIVFFYASPNTIIAPGKDKVMKDIDGEITFKINEKVLARINKATAVLGVPYVSFISDGNSFKLVSCDKENATSDQVVFTDFEIIKNEKKLKMFAKFENLKLLPGNYEVSLSEDCIAFFNNVDMKVKYWIALEVNN